MLYQACTLYILHKPRSCTKRGFLFTDRFSIYHSIFSVFDFFFEI
jgi:hypothetical protein